MQRAIRLHPKHREAGDGHNNARDVSDERAEVNTVPVVVHVRLLGVLLARSGRVERRNVDEASTDNVVVGHHGAADRREKSEYAERVGGKVVAAFEKTPWAHRESDGCGDQRASTNVDKPRTGSRKIVTSRKRVGSDIDTNLTNDEGEGDEKHSRSRTRVWVRVQPGAQQINRVPDQISVDDLTRTCDDDTQKARDREVRGTAKI